MTDQPVRFIRRWRCSCRAFMHVNTYSLTQVQKALLTWLALGHAHHEWDLEISHDLHR